MFGGDLVVVEVSTELFCTIKPFSMRRRLEIAGLDFHMEDDDPFCSL